MKRILPGFILALVIGVIAKFLGEHYGAPPMLFALLIGIAFSFLSETEKFSGGVKWTSSFVLRVGVALLGLRLSMGDVVALGWGNAALICFAVASTILVGRLTAKALGISGYFGVLTGGSVAICGASAAMAISSVLPDHKHKDRDLSLTIIGITFLSTTAMILYPVIVDALSLSEHEAGIFLGGTIHDVAQVVGAGYSVSDEVGDMATLTKLTRVSLLVPVVMMLSFYFKDYGTKGKKAAKFPLFLLAFISMMLINSFLSVPELLKNGANEFSRMALIVSIAAIGVKSNLKQILSVGFRPIILIVAETLWLAILVLGVIQVRT